MTTNNTYCIISGDPVEGFTVTGPFSEDEAQDYAFTEYDKYEGRWVIEINSPTPAKTCLYSEERIRETLSYFKEIDKDTVEDILEELRF